jgi:hypothetical protein
MATAGDISAPAKNATTPAPTSVSALTFSDRAPKPPFALAIGIVGHRPRRLPPVGTAEYNRLTSEVARVLKEIKREARVVCDRYYEFFSKDSQKRLELALVTALAEGADTIVTEEANKEHYFVDAVLPFERSLYEPDFPEAARTKLSDCIALARSTLVLPGTREIPVRKDDPAAKKAYEVAGLTVIGNCDILIALWDGGASGGQGGTTEMLKAAATLGVPIIHIDARATKPTVLKWSGLVQFPVQADQLEAIPEKPLADALPMVMDGLVRPPDEPLEKAGLQRYFDTCFWRVNPCLAFPILMSLLWVRRPSFADLVPRRLTELSTKFLDLFELGKDRAPNRLVEAYAWADATGSCFAQVFRSAFVLNFLAAAFAVAAALTSLLVQEDSPWAPGAEIALICFVILNTWIGRRKGWHNRWVEAREVAERLRVATLLWAVGTRPRAFISGEPAWTGWYVRAMVRVESLRSCAFDPAELDNARKATIEMLRGQHKYHETNEDRMKKLAYRLEKAGEVLFVLTLLVALDHLLLHGKYLNCIIHNLFHTQNHQSIGTWLSAVLPAFATATYGIRVIGDFEGSAKRSEHASEALSIHIAALRQDPSDLEVLRYRARLAGEAMLGEVSSWRLAVESRGLAIPG